MLTADQLPRVEAVDRPVLCLHDAVFRSDLVAAPEVVVEVPEYRGRSVIPVLAWLVATRLAAPDARVSWCLDRRQGPDSVLRLLTSLGWGLERRREGGRVVLVGTPPPSERVGPLPEPARFTTRLGAVECAFAADYGVFSPREVDAGTRLLFESVLRRQRRVDTLADIGVGYGALAVGLLRNGLAERAWATDVDSLALLLAGRNAEAAGVRLSLVCSSDPGSLPATGVTVCNVPTHIDAEATAALMRALGARARGGPVHVVVHASLEQRYRRHLVDQRLRVECDPGPAHVVLTARA